MFRRRKRIELNTTELRIIVYSLNNFRNKLLRKNIDTSMIDNVLLKLGSKMKVDKYELEIIIDSLNKRRINLMRNRQDFFEVTCLLMKLIKIYSKL